MSFDDRALRLDILFRGVTKNDRLIAKIAKIGEVSQIAKTETRYRELLIAKWRLRSTEAVSNAVELAQEGEKSGAVSVAVHSSMAKWPQDVYPATKQTVENIYSLARKAGWKKASGQSSGALVYDGPKVDVKKAKKPTSSISIDPSFDVKDKAAIEAIVTSNMFWIGEHYGEHIAKAIAEAVKKTMLEAGSSHKRAGELVKKVLIKMLGEVKAPGGYNGSAESYFEGVAANAATVARVHGQLRSFAQIGITKYVITNPWDERTCPVCRLLEGKVFTVSQGANQLKKEAAAKRPDDLKKIHPWLSANEITEIGEDSDSLAESGLSLPPYHLICRCTVDLDSSSSSSFDSLEPSDLF